MASPVTDRPCVGLDEESELAGSTHQRRVAPPSDPGGSVAELNEPVRWDAIRLSLEFEGFELLDPDGVAHEPVRLATEQNLAGRGRLFESGRNVHGVARDKALTIDAFTGDHLAGIHPCAHGDS